jgi:hypothetical protein
VASRPACTWPRRPGRGPGTGLLGDFIDPGQAGLIVVGESKVKDAVQKAVTKAVKENAEDLDVDPKEIDKTLQQAIGEM